MENKKIKEFLEKLDYGPAPESDEKVRTWLKSYGNKFEHFINGVWREPRQGDYLETINPGNREVLAKVARGTEKDVEAAVKAAKKAFDSWRNVSGHERAKYLYAIARAIAKNARQFAVLESLNNGKPIRETRDFDIPAVIRHFYYHAGWAEIVKSEYPDYQPGGVVAQIV